MCGITGYLWLHEQANEQLVERMNATILHRGPDEGGAHVDGGCAIAMRRLSIIDLSSGRQPIANEDESAWIVFNGEIYNYVEIRVELQSRGHRFRTNSDTETILHLYEEWGVDGFSRLRGMFAFAIWNSQAKELLLARDRFGKKPLYYSVVPEGRNQPAGLYFGSELKCLLTAGAAQEMDVEALQLYFWLSYIPDPYSAFESVRKLPAGGWLKMDCLGKVTQGRYWNCPPPNPNERPDSEKPASEQRLVELFDESVKARLISDVPLGAFLSGGIDSSLVVASMALQTTEPVKTFSIGFEESDFSELPYARMVAERYGTDHHELVVRPDSINLTERLARHFDEPFADSSAIPTLMVSEFARRHVKVALSGDGGDELFAGYTRFQEAKNSLKFDRIPPALRSLMGSVAQGMPYSARGKNYLRMISRGDSIERYFEANYAPYFMRRQLFTSQWVAPTDRVFLQRALNGSLLGEPYGVVEQALHYETTANLVGDMLVKVDRMSMAVSLEVRCPLLDHLLGEFAADLPTNWKMQPGQGKKILIDALGSRLPPQILNRPKQGFGVPIAHWFRTSMHDFIRDTLTAQSFLDRGFVSPGFLKTLIDEHQRGRRDNSHWLWSLLMLERWLSRMKEFQPSSPQSV